MDFEIFADHLAAAQTKDDYSAKTPYDYNDVLCPRDDIMLYREVLDIEEAEHFYSALSNILLKAPVFRNSALTLCCAVPVKHFLPEGSPELAEYLDLVILRGQDVVMAVKVARPDLGLPSSELLLQDFKKTLLLSALPLFILNSTDFIDPGGPEPDVDLVIMAGQIESLLIQQLHSKRPCVRAPLLEIPDELLSSLIFPRFGVLDLDDEWGWFPTEFGRNLGILQGFRLNKDDCPDSLFCCAEENLDALREVLSWGERPILSQTQKPQENILLFRHICPAKQGYPDNDTAAAALLDMTQNFARTPLTEYLRDEPEKLKSFQGYFNAATFQEAVRCFEHCDKNELMAVFDWFLDVLVKPLLQRTDIPLADKPLRSVIWAASMLSRSKYLVWQGEVFLHDHDIFHHGENWSYRKWLQWLIEARDETDDIKSINLDIKFLVIELFSLVCAADLTAAPVTLTPAALTQPLLSYLSNLKKLR